MRRFTTEEIKFIQEHLHQDAATLMLQAKRYPGLSLVDLVHQIKARQKAAIKLPTWAAHAETIFPVTLSVEQSSSEATAAFKAALVKGKLLIDLTGGFGVDSLYFAKTFEQVIHLEQNQELQEIAAYNFNLLGSANIQSIHTTAEAFLNSFTQKASVIYLDPARRGNRHEKLHLLQDCEPDILSLLPVLFSKADAILLKTSPMLDIELAIAQLQHVTTVWVLAVQNEVKEVLYLLQPNSTAPELVERNAVNMLSNGQQQVLSFTKAAEEESVPVYTLPLTYVYEPNVAILKAGAYRYLGTQLGLGKLHPNSHLYTSAHLITDFPGRSFKCLGVSSYNKKELLRLVPAKQANITVRNFPESVAEIRKRTGIKEGGSLYLFFTTNMQQKPTVLLCEKV